MRCYINVEKGQIYIRRELHDKYSGNRQGGIGRCPKHGIILLFISERGKEFGYEDGWKDGFCFSEENTDSTKLLSPKGLMLVFQIIVLHE